MQNIKKISICFIIIMIIVSCMQIVPCTYATFDDPIENPAQYRPGTNWRGNSAKFTEIGKTIVAVIQTIGTVISVITLIGLGLKYMMGSTQARATYKETMVPYLIGAIMVFALPNLLGIFYNIIVENIK